MAFKTKFISAPNASFNPNGARMSPEMAAAPYEAQARAQGQIANAVQDMGSVMMRFQGQEEKPDELYLAQSKADFEINYNNEYNKLKGSVQPNGDLVNQTNDLFAKLSKPYMEQAPNDVTRSHLAKSFLPMNTATIKSSQNLQWTSNQEGVMKSIESNAVKSSSLLALGAEGEQVAMKRTNDIAAAAMGAGYNATKIQEAAEKANKQIFMQSRLYEASQDPFKLLKEATSGAFADKGVAAQESIKKAALEQIGGQYNKYGSSMEELNKSLLAGLNPEAANTNDMNAAANLLGQDLPVKDFDEKRKALSQKVSNNAVLLDMHEKIKELNPDELRIASKDLQTKMSTGQIAPSEFVASQALINNRIGRIEDDALSYYSSNSMTDRLTPMPGAGTKQDSPEWQSFVANRLNMSDKASARMNMSVAPLLQDEVKASVSQWGSLTYDNKVEQLKMFSTFGPKGANQIADLITNTTSKMGDGGAKKELAAIPMVVRLLGQQDNMSHDLGVDILKGSEKLATGTTKWDSDTKNEFTNATKTAFGNAFENEPKKREQILAATEALLTQRISEGGTVDEATVKAAISRVGGFVDDPNHVNTNHWYSGSAASKMILPRADLTQADVNNFLSPDSEYSGSSSREGSRLQMVDLVNFGNGPPMIKNPDKSDYLLGVKDVSDYRYTYIGAGKYMLVRNGEAVYTKGEDGKEIPYQIDLKSYFDVKKPLATNKGDK